MEVVDRNRKYNKIIIILSVAIPLVVAALFGVKIEGFDFSFLPPIYATCNAITAILLVAGYISIRRNRMRLHEYIMKTCIILSAAFLVMYLLYHMTSDPTSYGGSGTLKYIYYFILITHIVLSIAVIPLVLFTFVRALAKRYDRHRKLGRITLPVWFYVAVSGVLVYWMISPYYA